MTVRLIFSLLCFPVLYFICVVVVVVTRWYDDRGEDK